MQCEAEKLLSGTTEHDGLQRLALLRVEFCKRLTVKLVVCRQLDKRVQELLLVLGRQAGRLVFQQVIRHLVNALNQIRLNQVVLAQLIINRGVYRFGLFLEPLGPLKQFQMVAILGLQLSRLAFCDERGVLRS